MQIRLTVLAAPPGGQTARRACDVLVTAPAGTALAAVASGIAAAVAGPDGAAGTGPVVLYAGRERLDLQRCALGEPPLVDGAVLALQAPAQDTGAPDGAVARLHVVAGPDAGGVHLLHPGDIRVGRSADADVPLDDPDVSRLHCEVTVAADGHVTVADLGSTNGTTLDGRPVGSRPVRLPAGALLRIGESALRLSLGAEPAAPLPTAPDGEGHVRVTRLLPEAAATAAPAFGGPGTDAAGPAGGGGTGTGFADAGGHERAAGARGGAGDGSTRAGTGTVQGMRHSGALGGPGLQDGTGGHGASPHPGSRQDASPGSRPGAGADPRHSYAREGGPSGTAPAPADPRC
ncbi:FHA domain-containing protein, partial [Streptomyces sp. NPDC052644]